MASIAVKTFGFSNCQLLIANGSSHPRRAGGLGNRLITNKPNTEIINK
jgi:hypothetical protein